MHSGVYLATVLGSNLVSDRDHSGVYMFSLCLCEFPLDAPDPLIVIKHAD